MCRTVHPKRDMERIVRTADGRAVPDPSGRTPGRGTYVCADPVCRANPARRQAIARSLGVSAEVVHAAT